MMGWCWMLLEMFVGYFFVSNFFLLDFPGYTYPIKLGKLGIISFFVFAFALAFCYFGRHLLHENRSLELRLLTQLHNYLLLIKNG